MYVHKAAGREDRATAKKENRGKSKIGIDRERRGRELVTAAHWCWCEKKILPLKNEDKKPKLG